MLILIISHGGGGSEGKTVKDQHEMIVYTNLLTGGTLSGCINGKKLKVKKCVGDKTFIIKDKNTMLSPLSNCSKGTLATVSY